MRQRRRPTSTGDEPRPRHASRPGKPTQWIYGHHAVAAALANPARRLRRAAALRESADALADLLRNGRAATRPMAPEILDQRALAALLPPDAVHQGMAIETDTLAAIDIETILETIPAKGAPHIVVLLDQVTDPHNVGAILRSAAAFGAIAVIVPEHGAPQLGGVLAKAASGALEAVPLLRVTNLVRCIERLKTGQFWCVGLDSDAAQELGKLHLPDRVALVLGAEGAGLRRLVRENCDFLARLPTRGQPASLNVSNAAAIALYALTQPQA